MSKNLRSLVLSNYKSLHKARLRAFEGDEIALTAARQKIHDEFHKNKLLQDEGAIKALLKLGEDVERILRTQVIQAREVKPGVYKAKIRDETLKADNTMYDDAAIPEGGVKRRGKRSCQEQTPTDQQK